MKTIITVTICIGLLAAGCAPYQSPLKPALQALTEQKQALDLEAQHLLWVISNNNEEQKTLTENLLEFMASLNNEQRESFEELYLQHQRGEITEITWGQRIEKVLSIEEYAEFSELLNLHNELVAESNSFGAKALSLQNRYTDLERRQKLVLQVGFAMIEAEQRYWQQQQQQQQQNQTYRYQQQQSNYQQQMLYELNSINIGLENLRQQKVLILPPPRPVPLYWQ